jgi:hypothetical protein
MTDEGKKMRFRERVKAMPEKERNAFWRSIMAAVDAGKSTGTPPEALAKFWVETYTEINKQLKETT